MKPDQWLPTKAEWGEVGAGIFCILSSYKVQKGKKKAEK